LPGDYGWFYGMKAQSPASGNGTNRLARRSTKCLILKCYRKY
jgi:hypothetical protein